MKTGKFDYEKKMKNILLEAIAKKELSGANILVMKENKELCYIEAGYADLTTKKKIQRDTIFRLYSMTKPITAAAAMILMERGQLCFQTPVEEYFPEFHRPQLSRPMIVLDLLKMTSGLSYGDGESETEQQTNALLMEVAAGFGTKVPITTQQFAQKAGRIPLLFEPGTSWKYGISADIMGALIEKVTGKSLGEFLEEEIFQPLGMRDTAFSVPEKKQERLAKTYETGSEQELVEYGLDFLGIQNRMNEKAFFESGGAGLVSTIGDYAKFAGMLLEEGCCGNYKILQPHTIAYLTNGKLKGEPQSRFESWFGQQGFSYGNYLRVLWDPFLAATLGRHMEYCWDGWLGCYFVNCPQEKLTFLVMQQKKDAGNLVARLRNVLFSYDL